MRDFLKGIGALCTILIVVLLFFTGISFVTKSKPDEFTVYEFISATHKNTDVTDYKVIYLRETDYGSSYCETKTFYTKEGATAFIQDVDIEFYKDTLLEENE